MKLKVYSTIIYKDIEALLALEKVSTSSLDLQKYSCRWPWSPHNTFLQELLFGIHLPLGKLGQIAHV